MNNLRTVLCKQRDVRRKYGCVFSWRHGDRRGLLVDNANEATESGKTCPGGAESTSVCESAKYNVNTDTFCDALDPVGEVSATSKPNPILRDAELAHNELLLISRVDRNPYVSSDHLRDVHRGLTCWACSVVDKDTFTFCKLRLFCQSV